MANIKPGQMVRYSGDKYASYRFQDLMVVAIKGAHLICSKADGYLTTNLNAGDLVVAPGAKPTEKQIESLSLDIDLLPIKTKGKKGKS